MTAQKIRDLAHALGVLLPTREARLMEPWEPDVQHALAQRLETCCEAAGLVHPLPAVLGDTLAGFLGGWGGRYGTLDDQVGQATLILTLATGGQGDADVQVRAEETTLSDQAIATLLGWLLVVDLEEDAGP